MGTGRAKTREREKEDEGEVVERKGKLGRKRYRKRQRGLMEIKEVESDEDGEEVEEGTSGGQKQQLRNKPTMKKKTERGREQKTPSNQTRPNNWGSPWGGRKPQHTNSKKKKRSE